MGGRPGGQHRRRSQPERLQAGHGRRALDVGVRPGPHSALPNHSRKLSAMKAAIRGPHAFARGFTLTEVMVVTVLAGVVTLGLITFYLNSQIMWTESSTQVLAQRDGTALLEAMRA